MGFGKYQLQQYVLQILPGFLSGIHMLSLTVVAPTPDHRCFIDELDGQPDLYPHASYSYFNESILSNYIPYSKKDSSELDSCRCYHGNSTTGEGIVSCTQNLYDTSTYATSRVVDFHLVCEQRWKRAIIQTMYMFGVLVGAVVLGSLADKVGRKLIFCVSGLGQLIFGLLGPFVTNFGLYCTSLFFYGVFGSGGASVTGFVLIMELVPEKWRTFCGTFSNLVFAIGVMLVSLWAYFIPNVKILQVVLALHSLLLVAHWWILDESIPWLWSTGRRQEAIRLLEKMTRTNDDEMKDPGAYVKEMTAQNDESPVSMEEGSGPETTPVTPGQQRTYGVFDLFKKPVLRFRTLAVAFLWFANSLVYYGLSLNTGNLEGNPYLVLFLIGGVADMPGYFLVMGFVDKTGRRCLQSAMLGVGGAMCLVVAFMQPGALATGLVMVGKVAIAGSFAIIYNYTAELFPTVVRNSAVGFGACSARFSGMLTPLISLLDSVGAQFPTLIFGSVALVAAFLALLLPETLHMVMPQTLEEGEAFGVGDIAFRACLTWGRQRRRHATDFYKNSSTSPKEQENELSHNDAAVKF